MKLMKLCIFVLMFFINGCGNVNLAASTGNIDNSLVGLEEIEGVTSAFSKAMKKIQEIGGIKTFLSKLPENESRVDYIFNFALEKDYVYNALKSKMNSSVNKVESICLNPENFFKTLNKWNKEASGAVFNKYTELEGPIFLAGSTIEKLKETIESFGPLLNESTGTTKKIDGEKVKAFLTCVEALFHPITSAVKLLYLLEIEDFSECRKLITAIFTVAKVSIELAKNAKNTPKIFCNLSCITICSIISALGWIGDIILVPLKIETIEAKEDMDWKPTKKNRKRKRNSKDNGDEKGGL
jgi:hypothetical protein